MTFKMEPNISQLCSRRTTDHSHRLDKGLLITGPRLILILSLTSPIARCARTVVVCTVANSQHGKHLHSTKRVLFLTFILPVLHLYCPHSTVLLSFCHQNMTLHASLLISIPGFRHPLLPIWFKSPYPTVNTSTYLCVLEIYHCDMCIDYTTPFPYLHFCLLLSLHFKCNIRL